jgi:hypothetical protein
LGRYGTADNLCACIGLLPYRCSRCGRCFRAMRDRLRKSALLLLVAIGGAILWFAKQ